MSFGYMTLKMDIHVAEGVTCEKALTANYCKCKACSPVTDIGDSVWIAARVAITVTWPTLVLMTC
jgi:hypothetical protein